jgi:nucleotide-binding universal stress UspA family protein
MFRQHETRSYAIVSVIDYASLASEVLQGTLEVVRHWPHADVHLLGLARNAAGLISRKADDCREVESALAQLRRYVADFLATHERGAWKHTRIFLHARCGNQREEIVNVCAEAHADVLIIGKAPVEHGRAIGEDVVEFVLRQSVCPTLVVQRTVYDEPGLVSSFRHCPACVDMRKRTSGVQWFCSTHGGEDSRSVAQLYGV